MRRYITIFAGLVMIAGGVYVASLLIGNKKKKQPKNREVIPVAFVREVKNSTIPVQVVESGRLLAKNRIQLYAEVQGVMETTKKEFKPGATYRKGEVMVKIRSNDYYAKLQAQKSMLQNLITSILPDLHLDYPEAYPKWDAYLRKFDLDKPIPPLPETTSDKEKFFVTGRNIYNTYYNTKNMEIIYNKYTLRAPFSGILTDALVTPGTLIRPGQKLGEFIDPTVYELEIAVNKTILPALSVGQKVKVRDVESLNDTWEGKIVRINGRVDPTTQTVKVFINLRGDDIKEGMYLEAVIDGTNKENAIEVNRSLLVEESNLFIVEDNKLKIISVTPVFYNQKTVIVKGLADGQKLLVKMIPGAFSGMKVKISEEGKEG